MEFEDGWTLPNEVIEHYYRLAVRGGVFRNTFYDGRVRTGSDFRDKMQSSRNHPVFVTVSEEPAGVAWLNDVTANYAFAHFFVLPEYWGADSVRMGRLVIDYWMGISGQLEFLIGMIPGFNRIAAAFVKRIGFQEMCEIPKMMVRDGQRDSCWFFYYSRFDHD